MNRPVTPGNPPEQCARREMQGCRRHGPADIRLVELLAALGDGRDQRITEAAAPIAAGLSGQGQGQARTAPDDATL